MIKLKNKPLKLLRKNSLSDLNNHKRLSIQISLDGFSFCIINLVNNELIALYHYPLTDIKNPEELFNSIQQILSNEPLLKNTFESVNVIHNNNLSALVPKPLFDETHLRDYLKFNVKLLENDFFTHDYLMSNEIVNVYIPYININNLILEKYGSFDYKHISTKLIDGLIITFKNKKIQQFIVHVQKNSFQLVVINENKLLFYNTFDYKTKEDFIYYILFVAEQLELNPEEFQLQLAGKIEFDDELYTIAYNYIRNISLLKYTPSFKIFDGITENIQRNFFTLLHN